MRRILLALAWLAGAAAAQSVPPNALEHLPTLLTVQRGIWPDAPEPWFLAGQVEQESCPSLKSPRCWNTHTELKTSREYGFGLGQITIAYRADGSVRFNKWAELRAKYPSLRAYTWEQRYDASYQLTALVEMDKGLCRLFLDDAASTTELLAFCMSAYNGGEGAVRQDQLLCSNTPGCDKHRWFGNVEKNSMKARVPFAGYGKSPFDINREYPKNILQVRRGKYQQFWGGPDHAGR
jgi:hypothetical protein